ncbi:integrase catalytic domain-containing protein [Trichonephila clavata]|uniref:Integrase catalytic domain-containing protein n=1 Tax=Trichonephila clavata TaxID=2740835 RepID=A0A8X6G2R6_TRICU|nr:integrase catalytic domain-containing protein [Trichonephila clavata]
MTSDKYVAMLLPLVESCIPEDILCIWLRNPPVSTAEESYSQKLTQLLKFLRLEVEGEQRVLLAKSGLISRDISRNKTEQSHRNENINTLPTRAALVSTDRDTLRCSVINEIPQNKGNTTKRTILSFVLQFYDPIGILSAATLLPKIWLQEAWKIKLAWEDPLPPEMYNRFSRWLLEVASLSKIEIPRYIIVSRKSELHVFVDASKNAYAACIFVRLVAWIKRFIVNCRDSPGDRNGGEISNSEFEIAEKILIRTVQRECFPEPRNAPTIKVVKDNEGLMRVKAKITERKDDPCFLTHWISLTLEGR